MGWHWRDGVKLVDVTVERHYTTTVETYDDGHTSIIVNTADDGEAARLAREEAQREKLLSE